MAVDFLLIVVYLWKRLHMNDFTITQKILEGCLLGDGYMGIGKNGKNPEFTYSSSSKQHAEFVHSHLKSYCTENYQKVKRNEYFDKRTNKTYVRYWFRTKCLEIFNTIYNRFYVDKIKIIPKDLDVDKNVLLFWYIGDGELESNYGHVKLHTNSFTKNEVIFLCDKLKIFNARPSWKEDEQYIISIPRNKVKLFLEYVGKCPFTDYLHKWKFVEYKNKNIEINGIKFYSDVYPKIKKDFETNKYTIYQLHKKYNVPIKGIKNYFNNNNIKWLPIDTKKIIIQYNFNNTLIKEWESGQEIKRVLKYNPSAISECCKGKRKKYNGFIWKFKL